jgi:Ti-type conjugative transfer relaxase TraA
LEFEGSNAVAIYHFHAKMIHRAKGQSAVAAAAYRSGSKLREQSTGITHDYTHKFGVEHSEILAPQGAPAWVFERSTLWNAVEASEKRKDAQVAREIEVGLPIELKDKEQVALIRDFVNREFVDKGMIADIGIHRDNPHNPHSHILLTTRDLGPEGFGQKNRGWNATSQLLQWRRGWAEVTNEHLIEAGLGVRIDHRSYRDQNLGLTPGVKIGVGKDRQEKPDLPSFLADRVAEQQRVMSANGKEIIADPTIALKALSHSNATFTHQDIARFLNTHTDGAAQFQNAYLKVTTSSELVRLGTDDLGKERFSTREMFNLEKSLFGSADTLANRADHGVDIRTRTRVLAKQNLSPEQLRAAIEITGKGDLKSLAGVAGSGKSTTLKAMREIWEKQGYTVKGAALAGIAVDNLQLSSGIKSRTLASYELAWNSGRDQLTNCDVLVIDEAGMLGTRQLEHVLRVAEKARAKVLLVGDAEQLQAIEAGAAFRGIASTHGVSNLTEVRRQKLDWQRTATLDLSSGKTSEALKDYDKHHAIVAVETRADARNALIARWAHDHKQNPDASQLVMAFTRDDVKALNHYIRALREQTGQLGRSHSIPTETGKKPFATNDRIRFQRNDRDLGVKNGSLGVIEGIEHGVLSVKLDNSDTPVQVDTKFYKHLDYGYAATVHKAQGSTVDRSYVLGSSLFDRHTAYVALSRHRDDATLFYAREDFGGRSPSATNETVRQRLVETLARARPKDLAHDYLDLDSGPRGAVEGEKGLKDSPEAIQARAREAWAAFRAKDLQSGATPEEARRLARESWQQYRQRQGADQGEITRENPVASKSQDRSYGQDDDHS